MRFFSSSSLLLSALALGISSMQAQDLPVFPDGQYPYGDVHIHPAFKPFNSRHTGEHNMWQNIDNDCEGNKSNFFVNASKDVPKFSQCHFEGLAKGNVRLGFLSIVPIEKKSLNINFLNENKKGVATMSCLTGISMDHPVTKQEVLNYYEDFVQNVEFIVEGQGVPYYIQGTGYTYEIIRDAEHLQRTIQDPTKLAMILNIEGGHTLGHSLEPDDISGTIAYEEFVMANVDRLKGTKPLREGSQVFLEYPILSFNLNHFFWNGLGGHARTFTNIQNLIFGQNKGLDEGLTPLGEKVVKRFLDKSEGRRIILDIKHMSVASRKWYYAYLEQLRVQGDTVAVISSHSTATGLSWFSKEFLSKDNKGKNKNSYLNTWSIGLSDEDVQEIHRSKGIIGIMLDKNKLMGDLTKKAIEKTTAGSAQRRQLYTKVYLANVLACVKAVDQPSGWDIVAIGSDFDGMITPFEPYARANDMPDFARDIQKFFEEPSDIFGLYSKEEVQRLMFDLSPEEITRKLMFENSYRFSVRALKDVYKHNNAQIATHRD